MMRDKRLLPKVKKILTERSEQDNRPSLVGYSREAKGLHQLAVLIVRLHRTMARNLRIPEPPEPLTMSDLIAAEEEAKQDEQLGSLMDDIMSAMGKAKPHNRFVTYKEANA